MHISLVHWLWCVDKAFQWHRIVSIYKVATLHKCEQPQGSILFVSNSIEKRMSDTDISEQSGLLQHLLPGK